MSDKKFGILLGVGAVVSVTVVSIAYCVVHIVSAVRDCIGIISDMNFDER